MRRLAFLLSFVIGVAQATPLAIGRLAWDRPDDSRIESYHVHCGLAPAAYTRDVVASGGASATEISLVDAVGTLGDWWCAATSNCAACGDSGEALESEYSNEVYVLADELYPATHPGVLQNAWAAKSIEGSGMSISALGSVTQCISSTSQSGSTALSIGATANYVELNISAWNSTTGMFSSYPPTLGGTPMAVAVAKDDSSDATSAVKFYMVNPPTGSPTLAWDWGATPTQGVIGSYRAYSGVDTADPFRSTGSAQVEYGSPPYGDLTTGTLTAQSGDLITAYCGGYDAGTAAFTWTDATSQYDDGDGLNGVIGSWAEAAPSGNQTVQCQWSPAEDGSLVAVVLKPAT